jgi:hypothetical protein
MSNTTQHTAAASKAISFVVDQPQSRPHSPDMKATLTILAAAVLALAAYFVATQAKSAGPLRTEAKTRNAAVAEAWDMFR